MDAMVFFMREERAFILGLLELFSGMDFVIFKYFEHFIKHKFIDLLDRRKWNRLDSFINTRELQDSLHGEAVGGIAADGIQFAFIGFAD